jgi:hypothetical protein
VTRPDLLRAIAIAVTASLLLGYGLSARSIASAFSDPVGGVRAQDESVYAHAASRMASTGGWLTPVFLGRYVLYKPPLVMWAGAASMRIFGHSTWALRLPVLLAAVLATVLLAFFFPSRAWIAAALLLSSGVWHIFARLCYTDMLLVACTTLAIFAAWRDLALRRPLWFWTFAVAVAGGVLAKSVAGLMPVFVLAAVVVNSRLTGTKHGGDVPALGRIALALLAALLLAAPWHLYQLAVHRAWFITDYVYIQILSFGLRPPAQHAPEAPWVFYSRRLFQLDPLLIALALISIPALVRAVAIAREPRAALVAFWVAGSACTLMLFQYRNLPYALQLIPALVVLVTGYGPWHVRFSKPLLYTAAAVTFAIVVLHRMDVYRTADAQPSVWTSLRSYAERGRAAELLVVSTLDEFYSTTLGLPKVRYLFVDPDGTVARYAPHFVHLGISVSVEEFFDRDRHYNVWRQRLTQWNLPSPEPMATVITAKSDEEAARALTSFPDSDLLMPTSVWDAVSLEETHVIADRGPAHVLALSRSARHSSRTDRPLSPRIR